MSYSALLELFSTIEEIQNLKCSNPDCLLFYFPFSNDEATSRFFHSDQDVLDTILNYIYNHKASCENKSNDISIYSNLFQLELDTTYQCQDQTLNQIITKSSLLFYPEIFIKTQNFFKSLLATPCSSCFSPHTSTFLSKNLPNFLFLAFPSTLLTTKDALSVLRSLPFSFQSNQLFSNPNSKLFNLSGLVFQKGPNSIALSINKKRTISSKALNILEGSLYDSINLLTENDYQLSHLFYSISSQRPLKITECAWKKIFSRHLSNKLIHTCSCGAVRETRCPCGSDAIYKGWTCLCQVFNEDSFCQCGRVLYKCLRCFDLYINHCKCADPGPEFKCEICFSQYEFNYRICKICLNPNPNLF